MNSAEGLLRQILTQLQGTKGMDQLAAAYVAAWGEIGNVARNAKNPHFGSDYADLSAVMDVVKPIFAKHNLALLQAPGGIDGDRVTLIGALMHSSGQHMIFNTQVPLGAKATAQAAGSAITYARRYQAQSVGGIAPVDDDGNAATESVGATEKLLAKVEGCSTLEELRALKSRVEELGDEAVAKAYITKQRELKGTNAGK